MKNQKRNYNPAAEGEAAGRADRARADREELTGQPYRVLLWNGREVEAWASGAQNNFATLCASFNGNWATLGEWPWSALGRARAENTPLRQ